MSHDQHEATDGQNNHKWTLEELRDFSRLELKNLMLAGDNPQVVLHRDSRFSDFCGYKAGDLKCPAGIKLNDSNIIFSLAETIKILEKDVYHISERLKEVQKQYEAHELTHASNALNPLQRRHSDKTQAEQPGTSSQQEANNRSAPNTPPAEPASDPDKPSPGTRGPGS